MCGAFRILLASTALLACKLERPEHEGRQDAPTPPAPPQVGLPVTIIATEVAMPVGLAADSEHVYWGDGGALMRAPVSGGEAEKLCTTDALRIDSIALAEDALFFGAMGGGVFRRRHDGGGCERITSHANPTSLHAIAERIWLWSGGVRSIRRDLEGNARAPSHFQAGYSGSLVADTTHVYWHDGSAIRKRPHDDEDAVETIALTGHLFFSMALDDTHLYWNDDLVHALLRAPKAGGPLEYVSPVGGIGARLAVDDTYLYVVEADSSVHAVRKSDGASALIALPIVSSLGKDSVSIAVAGANLFVSVNWMEPRSPGLAHIDLTQQNPQFPDLIPRGSVARIDLSPIGTSNFVPRPEMVTLATVYFSAPTGPPRDIANATGWTRWRDERLTESVSSGGVALRLVTGAGSDEAAARERAARVAEAIRAQVGAQCKLEVVLEESATTDVTVATDPDIYASVWAAK